MNRLISGIVIIFLAQTLLAQKPHFIYQESGKEGSSVHSFKIRNTTDSVLLILRSAFYEPFAKNTFVPYGGDEVFKKISIRFMNDDAYIDPAIGYFKALVILPNQEETILIANEFNSEITFELLIDYVFLNEYDYFSFKKIAQKINWYADYEWVEWKVTPW